MKRHSPLTTGSHRAGTTVKASFSGGVLKPFEPLELNEGDEVTITLVASPEKPSEGWLERTAGGWAGLLDGEELKREIYDSRLVTTRRAPRL